MKETEVRYLRRGAVLMGTAVIAARGRNIVAIHVDTKTKNVEVSPMMFSGKKMKRAEFILEPTGYSTHVGKRKGHTTITLPEFDGWDLFECSRGAKWTFNVCLIKRTN